MHIPHLTYVRRGAIAAATIFGLAGCVYGPPPVAYAPPAAAYAPAPGYGYAPGYAYAPGYVYGPPVVGSVNLGFGGGGRRWR